MQRSRRQDPYPLTWEVPLAATVLVCLVLVLAAHLARTLAVVLAGGSWTWPRRTELFSSLPVLLRGDATAGLPATSGATGTVVGPDLLWVCLVATEVVAVLLMAWVAKQALDRWGPGRVRGMATRGEVEQLLGRTRLRRNRATIRPDLFSRHGHHLSNGHHLHRSHHPHGRQDLHGDVSTRQPGVSQPSNR